MRSLCCGVSILSVLCDIRLVQHACQLSMARFWEKAFPVAARSRNAQKRTETLRMCTNAGWSGNALRLGPAGSAELMAQLSLAADEGLGPLRFQTGFSTDIGGGRENQDEGFVWSMKERNVAVIGILDGHGREVGRTAAVAAKTCFLSLLDAEYEHLIRNPAEFLVHAHQRAHESIRQMFVVELERQGCQVRVTEEGYLLKRRTTYDNWSCVHGGAACTLVALVGSNLFIANVGDSTALLCAPKPVLAPHALQYDRDSAGSRHPRPPEPTEGEAARSLVLTAEHSPESPSEFRRMRSFRARSDDASQPALYVVYDSASHDKSQCSPVFDPASPTLTPSCRGSYFKNVRKEWASLVSTPSTAAFQDALAFTRSLGDLHLHTYGVTHMPEVHSVDLRRVFAHLHRVAAAQAATHAVHSPASPTARGTDSSCDSVAKRVDLTLCVVAATDGVWDNWLYEDLAKFVTDSSCLRAANATADGAQRVATSLLHRNAVFAKRNFGVQADNATGIVMYISACADFPMQPDL